MEVLGSASFDTGVGSRTGLQSVAWIGGVTLAA
jgi:hypothetical protein